MPLANRTHSNPTGFSLNPFTILNDCQKSSWKPLTDKNTCLGKRLEMIILRYEGIIGRIPATTNYQGFQNAWKQARKDEPVPPQEDGMAIMEFLMSGVKQHTGLWFIPVLTNSDFSPEEMAQLNIPTKAIWYTNIKSVGMVSPNFGFYRYINEMMGSGKAISSVITSVKFGVTHKNKGTNDVVGLRDWKGREAANDQERELLSKAQEILDLIQSEEDVDRIFPFPPGNLTQTIHVDDYSMFQNVPMGQFQEMIVHQIAGSLFDGSLIPQSQLIGITEAKALPAAPELTTPPVELESAVNEMEVEQDDIPLQEVVVAEVVEPAMATANGRRRSSVTR